MPNLKYMRDELEDAYGILPLQDKILEIMVYIDRFCQEREIEYFLMGGSALGAARHGGFIPWDDDLDIFMTYDNYAKFADCCAKYLDKEKFYFQREDCDENPYFFSKLRMNGTACLNPVLNRGHRGIFVDIMCLNKAPDNRFLRLAQYYSAGILKASAVAKTDYKTTSIKKRIALRVAEILARGCVKKFLLRQVRKYNKGNFETRAHVFGRARFRNSFYPAEIFSEPREASFEKTTLFVPNGLERYLTLRYGDSYMELPDEKTKAAYQSHATVWDVDKDYSEYLRDER